MVQIKCQRCGHEWDYTGEKDPSSKSSFTNCPNCMVKVNLKKRRV